MEHWKRITIMVTIFTFSMELRPIDSFLTAYLTSPKVNITLDEVSNVLTPTRINYGVLSSLLAILVSDYLRYKPVMIFSGLAGVLAYVCLIYSSSIFILKVFEVSVGMLKCIEISYYGYLYATIKDKKHYQMATGCATAGVMSGMCVSGLLGQLIVYYSDLDYSVLIYYSLAGVTFASIWACFMPSVEHENHLHEATTVTDNVFSKATIHHPGIPKYSTQDIDPKKIDQVSVVAKKTFKRIYDDILDTYTNHTTFLWSFWHVLGTSGYLQIYLYINILYTYVVDVSDDKNMLLNGLVDSLATMSAAICTYKIGKINVDWTRRGNMFLAFSSLVLGVIVCLCYCLKNIFIVYFMFIAYNTIAQSVFVIVISQIGTQVKNDRYTLILGLNIFLGIVLGTCSSTILTCIGISIPGHFLVYGITYTILGIVYGFIICFKNLTVSRHFNRLP